MRYTLEINIDAPRDRVVELFTDSTHFSEWQPGLECYELVSGTRTQTGAKAKLTTRDGNGLTHTTLTIESNLLPDELVAIYETPGVWNRTVSQFIADDANTTRWIADKEFRFEGVRKALGLLEGTFKKETLESVELFKAFVERTPAEES